MGLTTSCVVVGSGDPAEEDTTVGVWMIELDCTSDEDGTALEEADDEGSGELDGGASEDDGESDDDRELLDGVGVGAAELEERISELDEEATTLDEEAAMLDEGVLELKAIELEEETTELEAIDDADEERRVLEVWNVEDCTRLLDETASLHSPNPF